MPLTVRGREIESPWLWLVSVILIVAGLILMILWLNYKPQAPKNQFNHQPGFSISPGSNTPSKSPSKKPTKVTVKPTKTAHPTVGVVNPTQGSKPSVVVPTQNNVAGNQPNPFHTVAPNQPPAINPTHPNVTAPVKTSNPKPPGQPVSSPPVGGSTHTPPPPVTAPMPVLRLPSVGVTIVVPPIIPKLPLPTISLGIHL